MLQTLTRGVEQLGVSLSDQQLHQLLELQSQLLKWNKAFNLTAISDQQQVLKLHLLDSLALVPHWRFKRTLDIGTGAGFPGLPLAIALPQQQFHLLDSNSKKIRFIRQQIHQLGLTNVVAHHARVEQHRPQVEYDCIVSRAFASISEMLRLSQGLLGEGGRWMAMKGVYSTQEVAALPEWVELVQTVTLQIPGLDAERCLIELARRND